MTKTITVVMTARWEITFDNEKDLKNLKKEVAEKVSRFGPWSIESFPEGSAKRTKVNVQVLE